MSLAIGIDVAEQRKGLDLVALGSDRRIVLRVRHASADDVAAIVSDLYPDVVCIDSPPSWAKSGRSRAAERELRSLGINAFSTPTDPGPHPFYGWMRAGFAIFGAIADTYPRFRAGSVQFTAAEVFPEASAVLLKGHLRPAGIRKGDFRRGVLAECGVDPSGLTTVDAVDAAIAALTGLYALEGQCFAVGAPDEGVILLPGSGPQSVPLVRPMGQEASSSDSTPSSRPVAQAACLCGCGAPVRRRFLPGHDAKLKSRLRLQAANGDEGATEELRRLGW